MLKDKIKSRREELGLTQEQLAQKTGYKTKGAISRIEKGERDLSQSQIEIFAKALNTTPSFLMGRNDDTKPLTQNQETIIKTFNQLNNEGQQKAISYTQDLVDSGKYSIDQNLSRATQAEIDQEVEAYRKELELQARTAKSSPSHTTKEPKNKQA
ncbi:helix-turn-helix domain-containing protein [Anaerococcus tetradius]|uniref:helix-turn-helix domain-containing protein n=1 Tax=Anaerococcus tetradius TaxID=33036 RepID=UPI0023F2BABE|nr:helix-turn-helix transcriptional regulator [Anaerococcus tetradius]